MLHKPYLVSHKGVPMFREMTRGGAEKKAFREAKARGWLLADVEIKNDCVKGAI